MVALKKVRDAAREDVRAGRNARGAFAEFAAINAELDDEALTRDLFTWIEGHDAALARTVYGSAEGAFLEMNDYVTIGRYMDPTRDLNRLFEVHNHLATARTKDPSIAALERQASESFYASQAARIVALLVLNNRRTEALEAAASARRAFDSPTVEAALKRALEGAMPEPLLTKAQRKSLRAVMP